MPGQRSALILANDSYDDESLSQLAFPTVDARQLKSVLEDGAIGEFETTLLVNEPHHKLRQAIASFARGGSLEDLLLLYFTGHGVKDEQGRLYFAASDTLTDMPQATGVEASFVDDVMSSSMARRQVIVLDCCFSGAFPVGMSAKSDQRVHMGEQLGGRGRGRGRIVFASSNAIQYSFEAGHLVDDHSPAPGSFFTQALVTGLRTGAADRNRDGRVSAEELYEYVYEKVVEKSPNQRPEIISSQVQGEIIVAKNPFVTKADERARAAKEQMLRQQLESALHAAESPLLQVRHAAIGELVRIGTDARSVELEITNSAIEALARLGMDPNPGLAREARTALGELTTVDPEPLDPEPVDPPVRWRDRLRQHPQLVAGLVAIAVIGVTLALWRPWDDESVSSATAAGADDADDESAPPATAAAEQDIDADSASSAPAATDVVEEAVEPVPVPEPADIETVVVGDGPLQPAATDDFIWVPNSNSNTVSVVDPSTRTVQRTIPVGSGPRTPLVAAELIWVPNGTGNTVTVIEPGSLSVLATITVGDQPRVPVAAIGLVWVPNAGDGTISVIDPAQLAVVGDPIPVGSNPVSPTELDDFIWVSNREGGTLSVIDTTTRAVQTIDLGGDLLPPLAANGVIWVADPANGSVWMIDAAAFATVDPVAIPVGLRPRGPVAANDLIWVPNAGDDTVSVIDPTTRTAATTICVGAGPRTPVAADGRIWVPNGQDGTVSVIDPEIGVVTATIEVGASPATPLFVGGLLWVPNNLDDTVSVIDPEQVPASDAADSQC